jgi:hypothetical protein
MTCSQVAPWPWIQPLSKHIKPWSTASIHTRHTCVWPFNWCVVHSYIRLPFLSLAPRSNQDRITFQAAAPTIGSRTSVPPSPAMAAGGNSEGGMTSLVGSLLSHVVTSGFCAAARGPGDAGEGARGIVRCVRE